MTQLAFTVCTNSHLAKAKSMADSLRAFNPDLQLIIGVVDELTSAIDSAFFAPHTLLEIKNIGIPDFEKLLKQYNPFELSCLGKPCFADFLLQTNPDLTHLYYFDADVYFYDNISSIEVLLDHHDIVITAHSFVDLPNGGLPTMRGFLNSGLYNSGFFALKRSTESLKFVEWWKNRLRTEGYFNFAEGMFVDQLWLNFVPLLFKNVLIDPHLGHNVGYWNMHERTITQTNGQYVVNETWPLVFFHFSGFSPSKPHQISVHQDRYNLLDFPVLAGIFDAYGKSLLANNHAHYQSMPNAYFKPRFIVQKLSGLRKKLLIATRKLTRLLES
ncbi:MAG: glycosyl transferase [Runella slithyformis]|nr:MAG: glycosyl transferase [Runella slithyformis]TAF01007.1 MAG: glycosyl transferase [Runella slithyformis]TAF24785.1 MAG: glycosyl transferase [Runella slithyformis]TAF49614.1 MAG: glycosyl transferase [Runella slithyformis]TAF81374.1 MAG: glycosyl transferase [Runella slithyformis]